MKVVFAGVLAVSVSAPAFADTGVATPDSTTATQGENPAALPASPTSAAPAQAAPTPVAPTPVAPTPVAPTPVAPTAAAPAPRGREALVHAGVQLGILLPLGVNGTLMFTKNGHPEWDVDVGWEPSNYWQSYSVAGAYHPWASSVFVGPRVRLLQLHAPWSRGYDAELDSQLGLGAELGLRGWLDKGQRWLGVVSIGTIYVASDNTSLPLLYTLNVGLAYRVFKHTQAN